LPLYGMGLQTLLHLHCGHLIIIGLHNGCRRILLFLSEIVVVRLMI
jgi:hypothetical protein